jgi:hypothetical protein
VVSALHRNRMHASDDGVQSRRNGVHASHGGVQSRWNGVHAGRDGVQSAVAACMQATTACTPTVTACMPSVTVWMHMMTAYSGDLPAPSLTLGACAPGSIARPGGRNPWPEGSLQTGKTASRRATELPATALQAMSR